MASRVKLPEFIESNPETWLAICDAVFKTHEIDDDDLKYCNLVGRLPSNVNLKISDILEMKEGTNRLSALRKRLKALFSLSPHDRYMQLTNFPALGSNQRPSDLLSSLRALLPDHKEENSWFFRHTFISKLPPSMRSRCLEEDSLSLATLADMCDRMVDSGQYTTTVHTVLKEPTEHDRVPDLCAPHQCCAVRHSTLCFFHERFKQKARKCQQPCSWNKPTGNEPAPGRK